MLWCHSSISPVLVCFLRWLLASTQPSTQRNHFSFSGVSLECNKRLRRCWRKNKLYVRRMLFCGIWCIVYRQLEVWSTYLIVCSWVVLSGLFCRINTAGENIQRGVGVACVSTGSSCNISDLYLSTQRRMWEHKGTDSNIEAQLPVTWRESWERFKCCVVSLQRARIQLWHAGKQALSSVVAQLSTFHLGFIILSHLDGLKLFGHVIVTVSKMMEAVC